MNPLFLKPSQNGFPTFARVPSTEVDVAVLVASTNQAFTKPTGAKYLIFSSDGDFFAMPDAAAAVPVVSASDGSASAMNPAIWCVEHITTVNVIAAGATVVTLEWYA